MKIAFSHDFLQKYDYARAGNPTRDVLQFCLASLEGAKHGRKVQ